jgi:hypothetical protein
LRLAATQQQSVFSRELPSIYLFSVWREKCVGGKQKYFVGSIKGLVLSATRDKPVFVTANP